MSWDRELIPLEDDRFFETLNGLWKGDQGPFVDAGVIRNTNFNESGSIDYSDIAWLPVEEKKFKDRKLIPGDVIIERSGGGPNRPVGRVVYFDRKDGNFSFSNFTSAIRVKDTRSFDNKFVFYRLMELYQSGQTEDLQRQTTNIRNLDFAAFKQRAQFPLLEVPEQQRIAQVLSTLQEAIAQQERLIRTTTELKQALMQKLFTEGLCSEALKETEIGRVPESWELVPVGQLFYTQLGKMLSPKARRGSEPKPYLRNKNVQWDGIDTDDLHLMDFDEREMEKFRLEPGDLLVCEGGEVGRTALWKGEVAECYYQKALHRLRPRDGSIRPAFMAYWMRYAFQMHNVYGVTGTRTTIAHLPEIKLTPLPVPLPSIDEQDEMLAALEGTDRKLDHTRHKLTALQDLFRTLLHELMTGKVRVALEQLSTFAKGNEIASS